jgi:ribonuclease HI
MCTPSALKNIHLANNKAPVKNQAPKNLHPLLNKTGKLPTPPGHTHTSTMNMATAFPCTASILPKHGIQLYTDGSSIKGAEGTTSIGAGVYNATTKGCTRINPGGKGSTHTNNRAELVALLVALQAHALGTDLTIYTDSLCSIQNIRQMMDRPHMMRESKHKALIEQIVQILAQRAMAGGHTYLKKVRSHTGIHGNDEADRLAKPPLSSRLLPTNMHVTHAPNPNSDIQNRIGKHNTISNEPRAHTPTPQGTQTQPQPREKNEGQDLLNLVELHGSPHPEPGQSKGVHTREMGCHDATLQKPDRHCFLQIPSDQPAKHRK